VRDELGYLFDFVIMYEMRVILWGYWWFDMGVDGEIMYL